MTANSWAAYIGPRERQTLKRDASLQKRRQGQIEDRAPTRKEGRQLKKGKKPAAVSLGRKGGLKGGNARPVRVPPKRRVEIARSLQKEVERIQTVTVPVSVPP